MKIQVMSDLHLEMGEYAPIDANADVIVLAGDINTFGKGPAWANKYFKNKPVVYVAGNHEYYGSNLSAINNKIMKACSRLKNIFFLNNSGVIIDGVRFFGGTAWTDFMLHGNVQPTMYHILQRMNDYNHIEYGYSQHRLITPYDIFCENVKFKFKMNELMYMPFDGKTVIVTHHLPSPYSLDADFKKNILSSAYASDMEHFFHPSIALWIHGHTHKNVDYTLFGTRVVANPAGYPDHRNPFFQPKLVVEI